MGVVDISTSPENLENEDFSKGEMFNLLGFSEYDYMYGAFGISHFLKYQQKWTDTPQNPKSDFVS